MTAPAPRRRCRSAARSASSGARLVRSAPAVLGGGRRGAGAARPAADSLDREPAWGSSASLGRRRSSARRAPTSSGATGARRRAAGPQSAASRDAGPRRSPADGDRRPAAACSRSGRATLRPPGRSWARRTPGAIGDGDRRRASVRPAPSASVIHHVAAPRSAPVARRARQSRVRVRDARSRPQTAARSRGARAIRSARRPAIRPGLAMPTARSPSSATLVALEIPAGAARIEPAHCSGRRAASRAATSAAERVPKTSDLPTPSASSSCERVGVAQRGSRPAAEPSRRGPEVRDQEQPARQRAERARRSSTRPAESGCRDSNGGPLRPERSALPGCATPREARSSRSDESVVPSVTRIDYRVSTMSSSATRRGDVKIPVLRRQGSWRPSPPALSAAGFFVS